MENYRKIAIEVQAIQWDGSEQMAVEIASNDDFEGMIDFKTGEFGGFFVDAWICGRTEVFPTDYVIKDKKGDYHVLTAEAFELIYEKI